MKQAQRITGSEKKNKTAPYRYVRDNYVGFGGGPPHSGTARQFGDGLIKIVLEEQWVPGSNPPAASLPARVLRFLLLKTMNTLKNSVLL